MKSTSTDPRAIRTRELLREALMQIVIEKPFRDLTIRDITQLARVNRATFYLHYDDKYALLEDCASTLFVEVTAIIKNNAMPNPMIETDELIKQYSRTIETFLKHFKKRSEFYRTMFGKDGDPLFYTLFRNNLMTGIQSQVKITLETYNKPIDHDLIEMMVRMQSAGGLDAIIWWLENDMSVSIEVMAERLALIMLPPIIRLIKNQIISF